MREYNKIVVAFGNSRSVKSVSLTKYDQGQVLIIKGLDLPEYFTVDFCNAGDSSTKPMTGTADGVIIPDEYLMTGKDICAYIVIIGDDNVQTRYEITIPVLYRPQRTDIEPTPEQQSEIDVLIGQMNDAVESAEDSANKAEEVLQNVGATVEAALQEAKDSGEFDGYSPSASVTQTADGAIISIVDKSGTTTAEVKNGKDAPAMEIDTEIDPDSTNAVQNKAIAAALDTIDSEKIDKPSSPATGAFLVWDGSAWVAQTLATWQGGSY